MSVTEETLRLNWEQKGEAVIDEANAKLRATEAELEKLKILYGLGSVAEDDYARSTAQLAQRKRELKGELAAYNQMAGQATGGTKNLGRGMLELSRAFEDAQYGLAGVLNNIPGMIQMFGGPAGLAAGISLAAVGFNILLPKLAQWVKDSGLWEKATDNLTGSLGKLEERIKELEDKKVKLAVDDLELENAKEKVEAIKAALQAVDKLSKSRAHYEKESGGAIGEMFDEAPGGGKGVLDAMRPQMVQELEARDGPLAEARAKRAELVQRIAAATATQNKMIEQGLNDQAVAIGRSIAAMQQAAEAEGENAKKAMTRITRKGGSADVELGTILDNAQNGTGAKQRQAQQELARRLAQAGKGDLAAGVGAASPHNLQEMDQADEALEQSIDRQKEGAKRRKEKVEKGKKKADRIDALNEQGQENQRLGRDAQERAGEQAEKARREDARRQEAPAVDAETAAIKRNGYAEAAGALLARVRAQGGAQDQYGRFQKLNESQQLEYVRREVEKELARRNPRMDAEQRGDLSMRISGMGRDQVDHQILATGGKQAQNTEKLLGISASLFGQAQQQAAFVANQGQRIDRLERESRTGQRTQLRRGK